MELNDIDKRTEYIARKLLVEGLGRKAVEFAFNRAMEMQPNLTEEEQSHIRGAFAERIPSAYSKVLQDGNTEFTITLNHQSGSTHSQVGKINTDGGVVSYEGFEESDVLAVERILEEAEAAEGH